MSRVASALAALAASVLVLLTVLVALRDALGVIGGLWLFDLSQDGWLVGAYLLRMGLCGWTLWEVGRGRPLVASLLAGAIAVSVLVAGRLDAAYYGAPPPRLEVIGCRVALALAFLWVVLSPTPEPEDAA